MKRKRIGRATSTRVILTLKLTTDALAVMYI
jgi:hypothetical protein